MVIRSDCQFGSFVAADTAPQKAVRNAPNASTLMDVEPIKIS
jgi:hypothetical protein